jgi:hypothetical protein
VPNTSLQRTRSRTGRRLITSPCYARPMPSPDIRTTGDGPGRTTSWLDGVPCIVEGFHDWPKVGERHLIHEAETKAGSSVA